MTGKISDWLSYAGPALIKVADSATIQLPTLQEVSSITSETKLPRTSDSLNEGLPIKIARNKFQRKR